MHSVLDLFSIGIGPSSSHTVGPMRAAFLFVQSLDVSTIGQLICELYGSLALTGKGHGTDEAIILGLSGFQPESITTEEKSEAINQVHQNQTLSLNGLVTIAFRPEAHILFHKFQSMPKHANGLKLKAFDHDGALVKSSDYYSVGGGFICNEKGEPIGVTVSTNNCPYPFDSAAELLAHCQQQDCSVSQLMWQNERVWRDEKTLNSQLLMLWHVMEASIEAGLQTEGILPGGLRVKRRAPQLYQKLLSSHSGTSDKTAILDWLSVYAMAVNEENAAGGRVVTAPTNGAAGVIPAVLKYYFEHLEPFNEQAVIDYLLTAGAIGILYKEGASLSAAEVGCQGEVGVACSMAAGALAAIQGGTIWQVENAAEIGMEHNLGLTCDPIGGLVQIPCIERNTMGAVKAVNAAHLALNSDGQHLVSLDKVIATMMRTGKDMQHQYKETSLGGLAIQVNMPEC